MDKGLIDLSQNEKTTPCSASLEREDDESLLPDRLSQIYDFLGARKEDVFVFTSSGAEAVSQVLFSVFLEVGRKEGKTHFIVSQLEDAPSMQMMKRLEDLGCFVKIAPVNEKGEIDLIKLSELISPRTALISVSIAQGLTGVIQPIEEIEKIAHAKGVLLHLDAAHALGKFFFSFAEMNADYLTFSGDKIHSLPSTGGLFAKKAAPLVPLILGKSPRYSGAADISSLFSLARACSKSSLYLDAMSLEIARLRDFFEKEILRMIPDAKVLFKESLRLPNTTVIAFPHVHQEALRYALKRAKIETMIGGDFCQHLFSLLSASNVDPKLAICSLGFSFSRMTTEEELKTALLKIGETVKTLRQISHGVEIFANVYTGPSYFSKKLKEKIDRFRFVGSFSEEEAKGKGMRLIIAQEKQLTLYWLVDETDGVIADAKFQAFGPTPLLAAAEIMSELCIRKTYLQASRVTADLIDQHVRDKKEAAAFPLEAHPFLNQVISAIDLAAERCEGIPCPTSNYEATPIAWDINENPDGIPGWTDFPLEKKLDLIEEVIDKEIRPYIELDAGGIRIVELKENDLTISYQGACTTCHSATGSTLSAIEQILKARLYPKLAVIPQF